MQRQNKASHSALDTAGWVLKREWKYAKPLFLFLMMTIPIYVGERYLTILLAQQTVVQIQMENSYETVILTLGAFIAGLSLLKVAASSIHTAKWQYEAHFRDQIRNEFVKKHLTVSYMTAESAKFQNMYRRGQEVLWASGSYSPLTNLAESAVDLIKNIIGYVLFGAVIATINPWISVLLTLSAGVHYIFMQRYVRYEYQNRKEWTPIDRKMDYVLSKSRTFETAKDVRIYGLNTWFSDLFRGLSKERLAWDKKLLYKSFSVNMAELIIILLRDGLAYYFLIALTLRGEITADEFVLYFAAISGFAAWVSGIMQSWNTLHAENLKVCDLRDVIEWQEEAWWQDEFQEEVTEACSLELKHVSFCYAGLEKPVLEDISVRIAPGEKIAIVGLNGAGKTTLIKNICGLYHPTGGEILVNGHRQKEFSQDCYMKLFSAVFQDFQMLQTGIAEMVASARPSEVDRARVQQCLELAGLWEKVQKLPEGMDTLIGRQIYENSIDLSGGEKQKLMLAKAIYKAAPVLLLDEPTAALDPIAENEMYQQYHALTKGRTSIFISHRLSSTRFCDRILLLEEGRIAECGSHEELMSRGGRYAKLYEMQSKYYEERAEKNGDE